MSAFGHIAVGAAVASLTTPRSIPFWPLLGRIAFMSGLALLPDVDIVAARFRTSDESPIAHRAAFHSVAFAGASGFAGAIFAAPGRRRRQGMLVAVLVGSHGLLDAFGHTTNGVALLWPVSGRRLLGPWHVLPNPPASHALFSQRGLRLLVAESFLFTPVWVFTAKRLRSPVQR